MAREALGVKRFARSARMRLLAALVAAWAGTAHAEWVTVAKDREREVQLDLQTVIPAEAGVKVAWGRVLLAPDEAARLGFAAVRALNRFDCQKRTFTTVKRVYLDSDGVPLRDEAIANPEPVPVVKGSVDERLWRAVCQPTSPQALQQLAQEALASTRSAMETGGNGKAPTPPAVSSAGPATPPPSPTPTLPIGVDLADPSQLPPELAQQPVPNLLPVKPPGGKPPGLDLAKTATTADRAPPPAAPTPVPARQPASVSASISSAAPAQPPSSPSVKQPTPTITKPVSEAGNEKRSAAARPVTETKPPRPAIPPLKRPATAKRSPAATWQYAGANGPADWHRLDPAWQQCRSGKRQSPIALTDPVPAVMASPLWLVEPHRVAVTRTPQGVIVLEPQSPQRLLWRERVWHLEAASWHQPILHPGRSGNYLGGWVLQWRSGNQRLFVEIPVATSPRTAPELRRLAEHQQMGSSDLLRWDWRSLLPGVERFFVYEGSEPWPPCGEGVIWLLYADGAEADPGVVAPLVPKTATARPVQSRNGRPLFVGER